MKHKRWIALLLAAVLTVGAMSVTAFAANDTEPEAEATTEGGAAKPCRSKHGHKEKIAEPENAIGKDAAEHEAAKAERKERGDRSAESSEDGAASSGRGRRHGSRHGSHSSESEEAASEAESGGSRRHGTGSKSAEPDGEAGNPL